MKRQYISPEMHVHGLVMENVLAAVSTPKPKVQVQYGHERYKYDVNPTDKYDKVEKIDNIETIGGENFDVL